MFSLTIMLTFNAMRRPNVIPETFKKDGGSLQGLRNSAIELYPQTEHYTTMVHFSCFYIQD